VPHNNWSSQTIMLETWTQNKWVLNLLTLAVI
jgi:hypothetical protein